MQPPAAQRCMTKSSLLLLPLHACRPVRSSTTAASKSWSPSSCAAAAALPVDLSKHHIQCANDCHHVSQHEALAHEVGGLQVRKAGGADLAPAQNNTAADTSTVV
jgi:hypothetical protein